VAEPYKVLPVDREAFVGDIPQIVGMEAVAPFTAYVERKLYIHNAAHAMLAYLGYRRGHEYGYEALEDPTVRGLVDQALGESSRALIAEHSMDAQALQAHVRDLLARFANRALADPIDRLARDPLRKLKPDDRLVGAARLVERHGIQPVGLATGIAAALSYDNPNDEHAVELQTRLAERGWAAVLRSVCGIGVDEPLAVLIRSRYDLLREDPDWRGRS
ncbi:MAG: mannitol-1-phosphate 5-dehydrogenase, partial [Anaerolineales bacterium]|nr:mannitol-1-phosphate 5-dehydrogenase [Anaerolineales bacterium]